LWFWPGVWFGLRVAAFTASGRLRNYGGHYYGNGLTFQARVWGWTNEVFLNMKGGGEGGHRDEKSFTGNGLLELISKKNRYV
jgi:hypothetical protein